MDTQRLLLFIALALILMLMWQTWELEKTPKPQTSIQKPDKQTKTLEKEADSIPQVATGPEQIQNQLPVKDTPLTRAKIITVKTDVLELKINLNGAYIYQASLLGYPVDIEHQDQPFKLLGQAKPFFIAQSGIKGLKSLNPNLFPDHKAIFSSTKATYELGSAKELKIPLSWQDAPSGLNITKIYKLKPGSYEVEVEYEVNNTSGADWTGSLYGQLQREGLLQSEERGLTNYSYTGGVYYTKDNAYTKIDFEELAEKNLNLSSKSSWAGFIQHYFVGAVLPGPEKEAVIYSYRPGSRYAIGTLLPSVTVKNGENKTLAMKFFLGPKVQDKMAAAAPGLELTVDYGWLTFIAEPLFWLLKKIYQFVSNWGLAIIIITILIKLVFYKLSETSYRSMARMRKLQPRLQKLKERFGDDKTKMNEAMMKIYREEKVNPMGGCLPILVQIPVFIALYWVLLESIELRQAQFLWMRDLSIKDPYFILPVIMGVSMFVQQKLNPAPMEPMQQKIMMALPLVFTVFFAFFPAGLVLYWVVNNIISIVQQWVITKRIAG